MVEVIVILIVTALASQLVGHVLVLRNEAMVADALSHAVLLGIVCGFLISRSLESPLLIGGATFFGVLTVLTIERVQSNKLAHDTATGLVFPFFFALAVIGISMFARTVHLDMDMVLVGEVIFAPLHRMSILGVSVPVALVKMTVILCVNMVFVLLWYQRLKLILFDPLTALGVGIATQRWQFIFMTLVSLTIVTAFEVVGSITVISFLVAPAMIALFWQKRYGSFLLMSSLLACILPVVGVGLAIQFDTSISGMTAVVFLVIFCSSFIFKSIKRMVGRSYFCKESAN